MMESREMLRLDGIMDIVQYLDQNNPEALKEMEAELQEVINKYRGKYQIIEEQEWDRLLATPESHAFLDMLEEEALREYREGTTTDRHAEGNYGEAAI